MHWDRQFLEAFVYATSAVGSVRFEILHLNGNPLAGCGLEETRPLCGDQIEDVIPLQDPKRGPGRGVDAPSERVPGPESLPHERAQ